MRNSTQISRPRAAQHGIGPASGWLLIATLLVAACGEEETTTGGTSTGSADTTVSAGDGADSVEEAKPSCIGVAEEQVALYAQYDDQCTFLSDCQASGKCWCGAGCNPGTTMCADSICADVDADCSCGDGCAKDGSVTICPNVVCKPLAIKGCEKQLGCRYLDQELADKCTCTAMPETEPNCYCGSVCSADKVPCPAAKCTGKNPDKCIIVPGQKWEKPYCSRCGLFAGKPRCFLVTNPAITNP